MKNKFKSYSFWMSVSAGIVLVLNNIGKVFGFVVESEVVTQIVDSICGILILFGVLTLPKDHNETDANEKNDIESFENIKNNQIESVESNQIEISKSDLAVEKNKNKTQHKNNKITTQDKTEQESQKRTKPNTNKINADKEQGE